MTPTENKAFEALRGTCDEVLTFLGSLDLAQGSATERMARLRKLTDRGGGFDGIKDKLVKALTVSHPEALYGNVGYMSPGGLTVALGHLSVANAILNKSAADGGFLGPPTDCAADHLRSAVEALRRT